MPADKVDATVADLEALGLKVNPSGSDAELWPAQESDTANSPSSRTKGRATELIAELWDRLPTFDQPLTINVVNVSPNSLRSVQAGDHFQGLASE